MFDSIRAMVNYAKSGGIQKIAVVNAHDLDVLLSLKKAVQNEIVKPVLIGKADKIRELLDDFSFDLDAEIIDRDTDAAAAELAVQMVSAGRAKMLMKGLIPTSTLLKAVLNKEWGLRTNSILTHVSIFNFKGKVNRTVLLSDAAINIAPDLMQKKAIIENAVKVAHKLGVEKPKVAILCAVEAVNPSMQATIDAAVLSKMNDRSQITGCVIDGPLAFDNVFSVEAAKHKGISSAVAGLADILIVPNIEAGNILYKTFGFFSANFTAGIIAGARAPIVVTSRSDSSDTKFNSIVLASLIAYSNL
ncbi:MAG: bifunctional enoyl-CoA hydratase/phosphate acetyltransferase [bacterium]|nr:bifunctional enoyl-CoA hydratase/phosphate acetyltransferase [bacterium]